MPREMTPREVRDKFIENMCKICKYWCENANEDDYRERVIGAIFSVLVLLDGESLASPPFIVAPFPHKDDKEFNISQGENYYPYNKKNSVKSDIAGTLHEGFISIIYDYMKMPKGRDKDCE